MTTTKDLEIAENTTVRIASQKEHAVPHAVINLAGGVPSSHSKFSVGAAASVYRFS